MKRPANRLRPVHPGEILGEKLHELGLTARALAAAPKVPHNRITAILNGQRGIRPIRPCAWQHIPAPSRNSG